MVCSSFIGRPFTAGQPNPGLGGGSRTRTDAARVGIQLGATCYPQTWRVALKNATRYRFTLLSPFRMFIPSLNCC